jgi:hypothetical protein
MRRHASAWTASGAEFVTAREGIRAVLDDLSWRPVAWLSEETFLGRADSSQSVEYLLTILGPRPEPSLGAGIAVLVTVPPSLRPYVVGGRYLAGDGAVSELPADELDGCSLWIEAPTRAGKLQLDLSEAVGPYLRGVSARGVPRSSAPTVAFTLASPEIFLDARVLLPWASLEIEAVSGDWSCVDAAGSPVAAEGGPDGLLLTALRFPDSPGSDETFTLELEAAPLAPGRRSG